MGNILYNPYDNSKDASSVQHFYDKLFKLKDLMNTESAKKIALHRHEYMESFIEEFYQEVK